MITLARALFYLTPLSMLAACSSSESVPLPIYSPKVHDSAEGQKSADQAAPPKEFQSEQGIKVPAGESSAAPGVNRSLPHLKGDNITVSLDGLKLPAFANAVFGDLLKVSFQLDDAVSKKDQLVTLRTAEPLSPDQFLSMATRVLDSYGIAVIYQGGIFRLVESSQAKQDVPQIIRSRATSNIPGDLQPIFYFTPLHHSPFSFIQIWLKQALGERVQALGIPNENGLLMLGKAEDVRAAADLVRLLDQPMFAGQTSIKLMPAYWSADNLALQLTQILQAEGYSVGIGGGAGTSIKLVPVNALNTILVFAIKEESLQHVLQWARDLDKPGQSVGTQKVYYLPVFNTSAKDIADILSRTSVRAETPGAAPAAPAGPTAVAGAAAPRPAPAARILVDEGRNALIFQGSAEEYSQFRSLVEQMDRAPLQVLIEATVAEVTLDDTQSLGAVFNFDTTSVATNASIIQSGGAAGLVVNLIRDRGQISAKLNALVDKKRVQILSSPRLVAASGSKAQMQVGSQVPIITTQQTAPVGAVNGSSNILQAIQYRDTGVILSIEPTINSNKRVQLNISQEVSDAQANDTSSIASPVILKRSFQTTLSLIDGDTVLLGGLISDTSNSEVKGIPGLSSIPILGKLFSNTSKGRTKTELIVLLTPYIIDGSEAADSVRDAFRKQIGDWATEPGKNP